MPEPSNLTVQEAGRILRRSPKAVRAYIKEGRLQAARPGGKRNSQILIPRSEVDRLLALEDEPATAVAIRRGSGA